MSLKYSMQALASRAASSHCVASKNIANTPSEQHRKLAKNKNNIEELLHYLHEQ